MAMIHLTLLGRFAVTIDGEPVPDRHWTRRQAAAVVKLLALAPDRRLHREQVIDVLWPDDTIEQATPKLHKAAHFARRALDVADSIVFRGDHVALLPDGEPIIDVVQFELLARRAVADDDPVAASRRSSSTAVTCCPRTAMPIGLRAAGTICICATSNCCD